MARQWTPAQSAAMQYKKTSLLVSAAAGSGKTATLTERGFSTENYIIIIYGWIKFCLITIFTKLRHE